jgi:hypothetical protein
MRTLVSDVMLSAMINVGADAESPIRLDDRAAQAGQTVVIEESR